MSIAFLRTRLSLYVTCTRALIHSPSRVDDKRLTQDESLTRDTVTASSQAPERRTKAFILDAAGTKTNTQAASSGSGHSSAATFFFFYDTTKQIYTSCLWCNVFSLRACIRGSISTNYVTSQHYCEHLFLFILCCGIFPSKIEFNSSRPVMNRREKTRTQSKAAARLRQSHGEWLPTFLYLYTEPKPRVSRWLFPFPYLTPKTG